MEASKLVAAAVIAAAMAMSMTTTVEGQPMQMCGPVINACKAADLDLAGSPSEECCRALEAKSDRNCLCALNDPDVLKRLNVTTDQVHRLATACNVSDDLSDCSGSTYKSDGQAAKWIGMFGFVSSSLIWSIVLA